MTRIAQLDRDDSVSLQMLVEKLEAERPDLRIFFQRPEESPPTPLILMVASNPLVRELLSHLPSRSPQLYLWRRNVICALQLDVLRDLQPVSLQMDSRFSLNQYSYPVTLISSFDEYFEHVPWVFIVTSNLQAVTLTRVLRIFRDWIGPYIPRVFLVDRCDSEARAIIDAFNDV